MLIEPPGDTGDENRGHEHRRQYQGYTNHRPTQLLHRLASRFLRGQAFFDVVLYAFDYDDGVVHHQADCQHQSKQR